MYIWEETDNKGYFARFDFHFWIVSLLFHVAMTEQLSVLQLPIA